MVFRIVPDGISFDFVKYRWFGMLFSLFFICYAVYGYNVFGINFGIDFTGGVLVEVQAPREIDLAYLRGDLEKEGFEGFSVQGIENSRNVLIRLHSRDKDRLGILKEHMSIDYGEHVDYRRVEYVGPQVGGELREKGMNALIASLLGIFIYMLIRFNWRFATGGIVALIHDVIIVVGIYEFTGIEFSLSSVAALLTIVGYSINDSVVIYDRIRENIVKCKSEDGVNNVVNNSINGTLSRTILTSLTTILAAVPIVLYGEGEVRDFSLVVLMGIFVGTYSSIFIAAPVLLFLGVKKQGFGKLSSVGG